MDSFESLQDYQERLRNRLDTKFKRGSGEDISRSQSKMQDEILRRKINRSGKTDYNRNETKYLGGLLDKGKERDFSDFGNRKAKDALREKGTYVPGTGAQQGAGFGLMGSFKSSRIDDLKSFIGDTPLVAKEASLNSLGFLTKQQKIQMNSSGVMGKLMATTIPLGTMAVVGNGMVDGDDPYTILQQQMVAATTFTGGIAGMRLAGAMSPVSVNGYKKGLFKLGGFGLGAAVGGGIAYGVSESIKDITSSESWIGQQMYSSYNRETLASYDQTQGTLTHRQKSLQQINSSVMNDRGFTLGNEASILKNVGL